MVTPIEKGVYRNPFAYAYEGGRNALVEFVIPEGSEESLIERVQAFANSQSVQSVILDLRIGGFSNGRPSMAEVTNGKVRQVVTVNVTGVKPVPPDGNPSSFNVIMSNLGFDSLPPQARNELFRSLRRGGMIFLNLPHPSLFLRNSLVANSTCRTPQEVKNVIESYAFRDVWPILKEANGLSWWEVQAVKP